MTSSILIRNLNAETGKTLILSIEGQGDTHIAPQAEHTAHFHGARSFNIEEEAEEEKSEAGVEGVEKDVEREDVPEDGDKSIEEELPKTAPAA